MLEILVKSNEKVAENQRYGETSSPCLPAPLLESPHNLPQSIEIVRQQPETPKYEKLNPVDEHLTGLLATYTDGIFTNDVEFVTLQDGSNVPIIDTFNASEQFAIGPRLEMLHKYHGIGTALLWLLRMSPIEIMTPDYIDSYYMDMSEMLGRTGDKDKKKRSSGLLPDWAHGCDRFKEVPKGLPYTLSKLIEDCLPHTENSEFIDSEDIGIWPIATCSWYGFEPMVNKTMTRFACRQEYDPNYRLDCLGGYPDMGQASDPTWMVLDDMIIYHQDHLHHTCMPPCHEATEAEDMLFSFGPFAKLLNYLSHDRLNH